MNYRDMNWDELIALRHQSPMSMQPEIAPWEHRAYARELVAEKPWMAPAMMLMTPGYQAIKMVRGGARTKPSMRQLGYGLLGTFEGLRDGLLSP